MTTSRRSVLLSGCCSALGFVASLQQCTAEAMPVRKSGLWEISVSPGEGVPAQVMKQCIDEKTDLKMQQTGTEMATKMGGNCSKNELHKTATGYSGEAECDLGGSKMVSKTTFTGSFDSAYTGTVDTTYTPAFYGQGSSHVKIEAAWKGECTAGMVPGDMVLSNGMKMNIDQMAAQAGQAAQMLKDPKMAEILKNGSVDMKKLQAEAMAKAMQEMQKK